MKLLAVLQAQKKKFKQMKDLEKDLGDARKRRIQASKDGKEDLKKRKMENEMKAVVYQTVRSPDILCLLLACRLLLLCPCFCARAPVPSLLQRVSTFLCALTFFLP
jgi:hypothetical protein